MSPHRPASNGVITILILALYDQDKNRNETKKPAVGPA